MAILKAARFGLIGATIVLYAIACGLPAVYFDDGSVSRTCTGFALHGSPSGFEALMFGWFPLFLPPWSANLLVLVGAHALGQGRDRTAARFAVAACAASLTTWGYVLLGGIPRLLPGYYVWQTALLVFAAGAAAIAISTAGSAARDPQSIISTDSPAGPSRRG